MRPYAFTGQPLGKHIMGVVNRSEKVIKSGFLDTAYRRLKYAGLEIDRDTLYVAIVAAAVFHDVGKAVEYYQQQFDEKGECSKPDGPSFYLHEILSAVYFDRLLSGYARWSAGLKILTTLAVLNHMHSLRDYGRKHNIFDFDGYKVYKELSIVNGASIHKSDLDSLVEIIVGYQFDEDAVRECLGKRISIYDVIGLGAKIRNFEYRNNVVRLYNLILLPVVVGDVLDAAKNRRNDKTTASRRSFILELDRCLGEDFYE